MQLRPNVGRTRGATREGLPNPVEGKRNVLLALSQLPTDATRDALLQAGIELRNYMGATAYTALMKNEISQHTLRKLGVETVVPLAARWKIPVHFSASETPDWAKAPDGRVRVVVRYAQNAPIGSLQRDLSSCGLEQLHVAKEFQRVFGEVSFADAERIAKLPYVLSIDFIEPPSELKNFRGRVLGRAGALGRPAELHGLGLTGKGVRVGVWDANVIFHPEFGKRIHPQETEEPGNHGTHVTGTVMGAGLIDPLSKGMAPGVTVYSWNFGKGSNGKTESEEMLEAKRKFHIHLTQNSYGRALVDEMCKRENIYKQLTYFDDDQRID